MKVLVVDKTDFGPQVRFKIENGQPGEPELLVSQTLAENPEELQKALSRAEEQWERRGQVQK